MLRFQHIAHLFALGLVPLFIVLFVMLVYWRISTLKKLGDTALVTEQLRGYIPGRSTLKFILLCTGFLLVAIGWANLQMGDKTEKVQRKGVDVMIALDVRCRTTEWALSYSRAGHTCKCR